MRFFVFYGIALVCWMLWLGTTPLVPWSEMLDDDGGGGYSRGGGYYGGGVHK